MSVKGGKWQWENGGKWYGCFDKRLVYVEEKSIKLGGGECPKTEMDWKFFVLCF